MDNKEELSFEELYNQSLEKETKLEKTVTGKIISINRDGEIYVDFGYKADGIIPKEEYSFDQNANPNDEFKVGDEIEIFGPNTELFRIKVNEIIDEEGNKIDVARHPKQILKIKIDKNVNKYDIMRIPYLN